MYKILNKNGEIIGYEDEINYVQLSQNGSLIPSIKNKADGIVFDGKVYNLLGSNKIKTDSIEILTVDEEGNPDEVNITKVVADEILVEKFNGAEEIQKNIQSSEIAELTILSTLGFEVADTDLAIENLVEKNVDKLVHTPVTGEIWRAEANYMKGDEVVSEIDNQTYIAQFYSRNKEPSLGIMKNKNFYYWTLKPTTPTYPSYEELAEGVIEKGVICVYEGKTYECKKQHFKSILYLPTKASHWKEV